MRSNILFKTAALACALVLCLSFTAFATNVNRSPSASNNTDLNNAGGIVGYVPNGSTNESSANVSNGTLSNSYYGTIQDEAMLIIPIMTMLEESAGLLFTALLTGAVLGIVGTLLVQRFRKRTDK